ncbi:hypothetical protein J1N35_045282 [Gossypium stocksii]|uniref:Uncharacterized protein n=1 Tax=Gossypium stocksii TaxID=47602 RepID=A0A9D3UB16_9ROSI|nr:hypothetical protein J1N35_045282 [Gossypium stocksii]
MSSRWLREADGSECCKEVLKRNPKKQNLWDEYVTGQNLERALNMQFSKSIPKESGHNISFNGDNNWRNLSNMAHDGLITECGPMDLVLIEENNPLTNMEGKKKQRLVGDLNNVSSNCFECDSNVLAASSAGQSSQTPLRS